MKGCKKRLDPLLSYAALVPGPAYGISNHLLSGTRDHPFFNLLIRSLKAYDKYWVYRILPYLTVFDSTGPRYISFVWTKYKNAIRGRGHEAFYKVRILLIEHGEFQASSLLYKVQGQSWMGYNDCFFILGHAHSGVILIILGFLLSGFVGGFCFCCSIAFKLSEGSRHIHRTPPKSSLDV